MSRSGTWADPAWELCRELNLSPEQDTSPLVVAFPGNLLVANPYSLLGFIRMPLPWRVKRDILRFYFIDMKRIDVEGRFIELTRMDIRSQDGGAREIQRGVLADRSGKIAVTCWDVLPLEEGSCYRIVGGYVKEYNGRFRLNLDSGVIIKGLHDDRLPSAEDLSAPGEARIVDMSAGRVSGQIRLRGTVVDVRSGSGIFKRCEECGRKLVKSMCTIHGDLSLA